MNAEPSLTQQLHELEESLADPELRRSPERLSKLLARDFREFGGSGRIFDKGQIIAALQEQTPCKISLTDFEAAALAEDVVLVTYRGTVMFANSTTPLHSLRSSIWRRRAGGWEVVFHQGTPSRASQGNENLSKDLELPDSQK